MRNVFCILGLAIFLTASSVTQIGGPLVSSWSFLVGSPFASRFISALALIVVAGISLWHPATTIKSIVPPVSALAPLGFLCIALANHELLPNYAIPLGVVLLYSGTGICLAGYLALYAFDDHTSAMFSFACSLLVSGVFRALVQVLPILAGSAAILIAYVFSWIALSLLLRRIASETLENLPTYRECKITLLQILKEIAKPCICLACYYICTTVISMLKREYGWAESVSTFSLFAPIIFAAVLFLAYARYSIRFTISGSFRLVFPFFILWLMLIPFVNLTTLKIVSCLMLVIIDWLGFTALMDSIQISRDYGVSPIIVYALIYLISPIGALIGCGAYSLPLATSQTQPLTALAILLLGLFALAMFAMQIGPLQNRERPIEVFSPRFPNREGAKPFEDEHFRDKIDLQCSNLARKYGLSLREREIVDLLARGYSAPSAGEKLFISTNTVKTHIKHIYEKLGIHKRQDLLNMLDQ